MLPPFIYSPSFITDIRNRFKIRVDMQWEQLYRENWNWGIVRIDTIAFLHGSLSPLQLQDVPFRWILYQRTTAQRFTSVDAPFLYLSGSRSLILSAWQARYFLINTQHVVPRSIVEIFRNSRINIFLFPSTIYMYNTYIYTHICLRVLYIYTKTRWSLFIYIFTTPNTHSRHRFTNYSITAHMVRGTRDIPSSCLIILYHTM